jgi:hypothetical protein
MKGGEQSEEEREIQTGTFIRALFDALERGIGALQPAIRDPFNRSRKERRGLK